MGYTHIENLYRSQHILLFKECYALEKVHGTSAHVSFKIKPKDLLTPPTITNVELGFFSGGAPYIQFVALFNQLELAGKFIDLGLNCKSLTIYGEAYGGKMQGMRATYGDKLLFIAFDVKINDNFAGVEFANEVVTKLGLEFVPFRKISADIDSLNAERDLPSRVAVRRGITEPRMAEGIVVRPVVEFVYPRGYGRIVAKHKRPEFSERASKRDTVVDPAKLAVLAKADEIAQEWVTPMRLEHVLDKLQSQLQRDIEIKDTRLVIDAMVEDVTREAKDEIVASKEAIKAISTNTGRLFKLKIMKVEK